MVLRVGGTPLQVLIDTNVFIERESDWVVPEPLQELEKLLRRQGHDIVVHGLSKKEIRNYQNDERRERAESKLATYVELPFAEYPTSTDTAFRKEINEAEDFNETVDNALLYAVYSGQVDILVTQDKGIHAKAERLDLTNEVFTIEQAREYFQEETSEVTGPPSINKTRVGELDVGDPIFDSLKEDYPNFTKWFEDHPDRDAYVNWNPDGTLGAILIIKPSEVEDIGDDPSLGKEERLKISTLKVAKNRRGSKTGELLINFAIREAIQHETEEIYLTHHIRENDYLVQLIGEYGFTRSAETSNGESIFIKRLTPGPGDDPGPRDAHVRFYPSYYDGEVVDKFLIPVKPTFHSRLFTSYEKRQPKISEFSGRFFSEGNAIKKAYISKANTRKLKSEDLLLFYRSKDHKSITSLGVCEKVDYDVEEVEEVRDIVGRRTVFTDHEIRGRIDSSSVTVILFKWHFDLSSPLHYQVLLDEEVITGPIQTIQQIDENAYEYIRQAGGLDERFTIN